MFLAIDKLFALHNAMLLESRLIKAFLLYSLSIFLLYMFTSTKQTYNVRPRLYIGKYHFFSFFQTIFFSSKSSCAHCCFIISGFFIGLCLTFLIEVAILRYGANELDDQAWTVSIVRSLFVILASCQLLYSIWTYRYKQHNKIYISSYYAISQKQPFTFTR